jgi:hypothetical protein
MTMEWSCLPSRAVNWEHNGGAGTFSSGSWSGGTIYSYTLATSVTGSGPSFSPGGLTGTQTFAAPSTGTYNYTLTCNGGTNAMTIPVTVNAPPPSPTATISINGAPSGVAQTVYSGSPVTIAATYAPVTGTLAASGINGNDQITSVPCAGLVPFNASCWTQPDATKTYTFTPAAGTYSFYAAEKTTVFYTTYNNYKSVTLTVVDQCPNGQGSINNCTSCTAPYILNGGQCLTPLIPTGTLLVNGGSAASILYGASATVAGTYTTQSPDTLTAAQIYNSTNATVANSGTPASPFLNYSLSYTTPTTLVPGVYTFVARESSTQTPTLGNNSGSSGLVTLTVSCPVGQTWNGSAERVNDFETAQCGI